MPCLGSYTGNECTWTIPESSKVPQTGNDSWIVPGSAVSLLLSPELVRDHKQEMESAVPWIIRGKSKGSLTGNGECRGRGAVPRIVVEKVRGHKQEKESAVPLIVRGKSKGS